MSVSPEFSEGRTRRRAAPKVMANLVNLLLLFIMACGMIAVCACLVAYSVISQFMGTADSFVAMFRSHPNAKPATPAN